MGPKPQRAKPEKQPMTTVYLSKKLVARLKRPPFIETLDDHMQDVVKRLADHYEKCKHR